MPPWVGMGIVGAMVSRDGPVMKGLVIVQVGPQASIFLKLSSDAIYRRRDDMCEVKIYSEPRLTAECGGGKIRS